MTGNRTRKKEVNDTYFELRARNNIAVKKSREKARHRNFELEKKLENLRKENNQLKENLSIKFRELSLLEKLLHQVNIDPPPRLMAALALRHKQQNAHLFSQLPVNKCEQFNNQDGMNMVSVDLIKESDLHKIAKTHLNDMNMVNLSSDKAIYMSKAVDCLQSMNQEAMYRPLELVSCDTSGNVDSVHEQTHKMLTRGQRTKQINDKRDYY